MNLHDRIEMDPRILSGKPVIRGTRLAVEFVVDLYVNGWSEMQILHEYPGVDREDLLACLKFASSILKDERV